MAIANPPVFAALGDPDLALGAKSRLLIGVQKGPPCSEGRY